MADVRVKICGLRTLADVAAVAAAGAAYAGFVFFPEIAAHPDAVTKPVLWPWPHPWVCARSR